MVHDDLTGVVIFSSCVELAKVIDQRAHTRRQLQHTVYQLTQGDLTCHSVRGGRKIFTTYNHIGLPNFHLASVESLSHRSPNQPFPAF